jgi:hypothetical protein
LGGGIASGGIVSLRSECAIAVAEQQVAVVLVESAEATGNILEGVLGVSERVSIEAAVGVGDRGPAQFTLSIRIHRSACASEAA